MRQAYGGRDVSAQMALRQRALGVLATRLEAEPDPRPALCLARVGDLEPVTEQPESPVSRHELTAPAGGLRAVVRSCGRRPLFFREAELRGVDGSATVPGHR